MDIYFTDLTSNITVTLPMLPETISIQMAAKFLEYGIMDLGTIKLPAGEELNEYSWDGTFPGANQKNAPYVKSWQDPKALQTQFEKFKSQGKKLRLLITETRVNTDVYINTFEPSFSGPNGDIAYSIDIFTAKDIKITTEPNNLPTVVLSNPPPAAPAPRATPAASSQSTYTVVQGDCLWRIAERKLGSGSRWTEIYNLNKDKIKNPHWIYPGQVFVLP